MKAPIERWGLAKNPTRLKDGTVVVYRQFWYVVPGEKKPRKESFGRLDEMSDRAAEHKAMSRIAELNGQAVKGDDAKGPLIEEWIEKLEDEKEAEVELATMVTIRVSTKYIKGHFCGRRIGTVTRDEAKEFRVAMLKKRNSKIKPDADGAKKTEAPKLSIHTIDRVIRHAKWIFQEAVDRDKINFNPFDRLTSSTSQTTVEFVYVGDELFQDMLDACPNDNWRCALAMARWAGMRIGEIQKCSWADFDWDKRTIAIWKSVRKKGTKKRPRITPLQPRLYDMLKRVFDEAPEKAHGPYDGLPRGSNLYKPTSKLRSIMAKAGASHEDPFHDLRRSLISDWMQKAAVPEAVMVEYVGNSKDVARAYYNQVLTESVVKITGVGHPSREP